MQKPAERVRRPSPEFLEPLETDSMLKKRKEVGTIVKLKNETCGLETSIASCNNFGCANSDSLPKNAKTSMFVILSLLYGKLIIVACLGFVVSQEITKSLPVQYYEGFFTFLFGVSIVILLYLLCFLLQDSACCPGNRDVQKKSTKKALKASAAVAAKRKDKNKKESGGESGSQSQTSRNRPNILQREIYPRKIKNKTKSLEGGSESGADAEETDSSLLVGVGTMKKGKNPSEEKLTEPSPDSINIESSSSEVEIRRRKTSQNLYHYGSFFLRVGAIGFGLGTMIYIGLQFGQIFEIPFTSPCYEMLRAINPILQMVFTFMQMYFIFMNARLKIHRFKFIARFGLMHVAATNICVWIKVLVFESLNELKRKPFNYFNFSSDIVNTMTNEYGLIEPGKNLQKSTSRSGVRSLSQVLDAEGAKAFFDEVGSNIRQVPYALVEALSSSPTAPSSITQRPLPIINSTLGPTTATTAASATRFVNSSTTPAALTTLASAITQQTSTVAQAITNVFNKTTSTTPNITAYTELPAKPMNLLNGAAEALIGAPRNVTNVYKNDSCGRINIMGTIVEDSAPFLYPFAIEYSLIGAAVIFIMWRHIGRSPRYVSEENIEHRLEAILSQKAVAMAHVQNGGRVDCVGASKGLFFGLLVLVGSLIAMLLFFVLIHHQQFSWLAVYLADASHSAVMALSLLAIIIGFCRAKNLRFYAAETTDLNDILLRVSAFGLFVYSTFSIIAGARYALVRRENLLVMITGTITIFQVVLQLLFIGDMSRRHVYMPEHDRNKPGRQIVTFLLICNITMWILFTFESQKVLANPVQLQFFGDKPWMLVEHLTLPLCIFHRFHSAVALAEIWKNSYKPRID